MTDWDFPTIAYLWDPKLRAIIGGADTLEALSDDDRARSLTMLSERVHALTAGLDDVSPVGAAVIMVDDLYKSFFCQFRWTPGFPNTSPPPRGCSCRS